MVYNDIFPDFAKQNKTTYPDIIVFFFKTPNKLFDYIKKILDGAANFFLEDIKKEISGFYVINTLRKISKFCFRSLKTLYEFIKNFF